MATSISFLEEKLSNTNILAALHTIRKCEGTDAGDGYSYLFGSTVNNGRRFNDYSTHPNQKFPFTSGGKEQLSSAAGAYQILKGTFDTLCDKYGFTDFSPHTQDLMACALFDTRNVLSAVAEGKFFNPEVLDKLNNEWASLPGAGYGQPEKSLAKVQNWYTIEGGTIA